MPQPVHHGFAQVKAQACGCGFLSSVLPCDAPAPDPFQVLCRDPRPVILDADDLVFDRDSDLRLGMFHRIGEDLFQHECQPPDIRQGGFVCSLIGQPQSFADEFRGECPDHRPDGCIQRIPVEYIIGFRTFQPGRCQDHLRILLQAQDLASHFPDIRLFFLKQQLQGCNGQLVLMCPHIIQILQIPPALPVFLCLAVTERFPLPYDPLIVPVLLRTVIFHPRKIRHLTLGAEKPVGQQVAAVIQDQIHIDHHKLQQCHVAQGIPFQVIDIENEDLYPKQDRQQQEEIAAVIQPRHHDLLSFA